LKYHRSGVVPMVFPLFPPDNLHLLRWQRRHQQVVENSFWSAVVNHVHLIVLMTIRLLLNKLCPLFYSLKKVLVIPHTSSSAMHLSTE